MSAFDRRVTGLRINGRIIEITLYGLILCGCLFISRMLTEERIRFREGIMFIPL